MIKKILACIEKHRLLSPGERAVVAVSGGPDSTALLHSLVELLPRLGIKLSVAHLDHCLRGSDSREDALFVESLSASLQLNFIKGRTDVARLSRENGISVEMAARRARLAFFKRAVKKARAGCVITGHNSDDQAETVLLKLARGSGPRGLAAMSLSSRIEGVNIVRPMLGITRQEIMSYLKLRRLAWREDASNSDTSFLRNRVRHEVLPFLERTLNPSIRETLVRTAHIIGDENDWSRGLAARLLARCTSTEKGERVLEIEPLLREHPAAVRRVIRMWLAGRGVAPETIDFKMVDRIQTLVSAGKGSGAAPVQGGIQVKRRYGKLVLVTGKIEPDLIAFRKRLLVPGETVLPEQGLRVVTAKRGGVIKDRKKRPGIYPVSASISASAVGRKKIYVRSWRRGDRIRPYGFNGSRKLQDVFVDCKVPAEQRPTVPVIECAGRIAWLPGYRVAEGWHVETGEAPAWHMTIDRI